MSDNLKKAAEMIERWGYEPVPDEVLEHLRARIGPVTPEEFDSMVDQMRQDSKEGKLYGIPVVFTEKL